MADGAGMKLKLADLDVTLVSPSRARLLRLCGMEAEGARPGTGGLRQSSCTTWRAWCWS
jgi:hypothetical protein